jgi:hypothetical protein
MHIMFHRTGAWRGTVLHPRTGGIELARSVLATDRTGESLFNRLKEQDGVRNDQDVGRMPLSRISTIRIADCFQFSPGLTCATPASARSKSCGSMSS